MDTNPDQGVTDLLAALGDAPEAREAEQAQTEQDEATPVEAAAEEVSQDQPEAAADDEEEVEFEGVQIRGKKDAVERLKAERLMQQDYTRKTQEVADQRRAVEDREQFLEAQQHFLQTASSEIAELQAMQTRLAQFDQLDWNEAIRRDPVQAQALSAEYTVLQRQVQSKAQRVQTIAEAAKTAKEKHEANQVALNKPELERRIGKITEADRKRLLDTAGELGIPAKAMWSPEVLHAVDLASKFLALQKAAPKAAQKLAQAPKVIRPTAPQPVRTNQAALDRLKTTGRAENLISFL